MTSRLRAAFEDLAEDAPPAPGLAARSWTVGRRRRRRRHLFQGAAALLAAVALMVVVPPVPSSRSPGPAATDPDGSSGAGVDHYPQRISYPPWSGTPDQLPASPGPLAATLINNNGGDPRYFAVNADGKLWMLDEGTNALSPDGRLIVRAALTPRSRPLVLQNLTTGDRTPLNVDAEKSSARFQAATFTPVYWAPDNSAVQLKVGSPPHRTRYYSAVVNTATGTVTKLANGLSAGFLSPDEAVTVDLGAPQGNNPPVVATTNLQTRETNSMKLRLTKPWNGDRRSTLANVSPDGNTLLLVTGGRGPTEVRLFSMTDGHELPTRTVTSWEGSECGLTWLGNNPVLPTKRANHPGGSVEVAPDDNRPLVALQPRLQGRCVQWAADALAGGHDWTLFGTNNQQWTWYWWLALPFIALPIVGTTEIRRQKSRTQPSRN